MSDEIERIRARLAKASTGLCYDQPAAHPDREDRGEACADPDCELRDEVADLRTLLDALDAERAEVERLRGDVQRKHEEAWTWMLVAQERARELLANQNRADSSAMETEALRTERDQARRAAIEEAIAQVDEAIAVYLGHASASDPHDWLMTVRDHIAELLGDSPGPDAP